MMSIAETADRGESSVWTCPFCPLLCDGLAAPAVGAHGRASGSLSLAGADCARADAALSRFSLSPSQATPSVNGVACTLDQALAQAAAVLAASRQPLIGGLGTDVAGARALYRLACATGAIVDAAQGEPLHQGLRALQDRGGYSATLAEVRTRADLIVCIGGLPDANFPRFLARCGIGEAGPADRRLAVVDVPAALTGLPAEVGGVPVDRVPIAGDLFDTVAMLAALVQDRRLAASLPAALPAPVAGVREPLPGLAELAPLARALQQARYAVFVWQQAALPAQGALIVEALQRCIASLNQRTRAAGFALGGGDGASTVNQVFTWLSGLPLRSRVSPLGIEHEPLAFDTARLLAAGDVDALLWVASFGTEPPPPATRLPSIVIGHPSWRERASLAPGAVFIPVATPGIGTAGHLFRADGVVLMPLSPMSPSRSETLPGVDQVLDRIAALLADLPARAAA